jgi:ferredoxin-NADP reductase
VGERTPPVGGWQLATVSAIRQETPLVKTFSLQLSTPTPRLAGQYFVVRLTAPDGYSAQRSYSVASPPGDPSSIDLTVERFAEGEVSTFLHDEVVVGDTLDVRGPIGGWFTWDGSTPALLLGGGSGVVPLMAMARTHARLPDPPAMRLLYSVREPGAVLYEAELADLRDRAGGLAVDLVYTRRGPVPGAAVGRVTAETLTGLGWPAAEEPDCFVCGPTGFVEHVADLLVRAGHDPARIRTERFGPTTGPRPSE